MKHIDYRLVIRTVADLCKEANYHLRPDIAALLLRASRKERDPLLKKLYAILTASIEISRQERIPICQDTGLPVIFVEIGRDVLVESTLKTAIIEGVRKGYHEGRLRSSVVHPFRRNNPGVTPPVIHIDFSNHNGITFTVLPKGFGSENKSTLKMLRPTAGLEEIEDFVVESVKRAGAAACPPYFVGVGIGGTADYALLLSKKALLKDFRRREAGKEPGFLQKQLLTRLNRLSSGIMGLKARTTCLGVNIVQAPTHIAGLPVGVSISCWVMRSASRTIYVE